MFGSGKRVWKFYCVVPCLLLLGAFSGCSFAYAAPTAEQSAIIAEQTKLIEANPKDYKAYFRRGRAYYFAGLYEKSEADCAKGLQLNPNSQSLWVLQSNLCRKRKDDLGVLKAIREAQRIGPLLAGNCSVEVATLSLLDMDRECYDRCSILLKTFPNEPDLYYYRGISAFSLGMDEKLVKADLSKSIELAPSVLAYQKALKLVKSASR